MKSKSTLVSACLLGMKCRYDGTDAANGSLIELTQSRHFIPVCPEQLGGLPTPRGAAEIEDGNGGDVLNGSSRVITKNGEDVTSHFAKGAEEVLKIARLFDISEAILKEKSPSCGVTSISRKGDVVKGMGVTTALLMEEGIRVRGIA
ncbi:MAG: DUF523 domain-containing protein [Deltaproteobacteria bacterium]|nr:DUF523 domain-containing protein [Deltaproteobacteria bacterium]